MLDPYGLLCNMLRFVKFSNYYVVMSHPLFLYVCILCQGRINNIMLEYYVIFVKKIFSYDAT